MIIFVFLFAFIVLIYQKKTNRDYIVLLPYYLLIFDFVKIFPYWSDIKGYNGLELLLLFFFTSKFFFKRDWLYHNIKIIVLYAIIISLYLFTRMSFKEDTLNYITRYGITMFVFLLLPITIVNINPVRFKMLVDNVYKYLVLYLVLTLMFSIFKIGPNMYNTNLIYGLEHDQVNGPALAIVFLLFYRKLLNPRYNINLLAIILLFVLFLTFKRTPLIMLSFGVVFYFFSIGSILKKAGTIVIIGIVMFFGIYLYKELDVKRDKFFGKVDTEQEGRFVEIQNVINIIEIDESSYFWGNGELFNTRGQYGYDRNDDRPIHSFYGELLLGSGIVGVLSFLIFVIAIAIKSVNLNSAAKSGLMNNINFRTDEYFIKKNVHITFILCCCAILIFTAFVGPLRYIGYNAFLFFLIGSSISQIKNRCDGICISNYN